jgi:hypothetical protein
MFHFKVSAELDSGHTTPIENSFQYGQECHADPQPIADSVRLIITKSDPTVGCLTDSVSLEHRSSPLLSVVRNHLVSDFKIMPLFEESP